MSLVHIPVNQQELEGDLVLPSGAKHLVVFAHGSGSSRHSPRNKFVAEQLQMAGIGTLLVDLLTEEEDVNYQTRFNIELLAERLLTITTWCMTQAQTKNLSLGYFGASTGAAAAIEAAARLPESVKAVVSRGGRVDMASDVAGQVKAPTLLIVGGNDTEVHELNKDFQKRLQAKSSLVVVPGASHLFEEPGTLEQVATLARDWFTTYL